MDTEILIQAGLSEIQAKIYLYLIENSQKTPSEIAEGIDENRTTVYIPNHPSALESLAEKRLRQMARQARNLEGNLPSLINFYNEHQNEPGVQTFYGDEGVEIIRHKIITEKQPFYYVRSRWDENANKKNLEKFKKAQVEAEIPVESITPSEFTRRTNKEATDQLATRTLLPPGEYDSPVQISIFGDNVTFINYSKGGMSTIIESPEIADAMRQFYLLSKKYIRKATDQEELEKDVQTRLNLEHIDQSDNKHP